jgi:hypothetical protein
LRVEPVEETFAGCRAQAIGVETQDAHAQSAKQSSSMIASKFRIIEALSKP